LQLIEAGKALGMSPSMGVSSATFIYVRSVVVLMYFIVEERIESFETEMGASDWLKLSEKWCARTSAFLAAAERISYSTFSFTI
jgi:hypothetical protein